MKEIYFINDFYVNTTNWKCAFRAWLKHFGDLTPVAEKSLNAMDTLDEMLELMGMVSHVTIRHIGIAKEFVSFVDYERVREEDKA